LSVVRELSSQVSDRVSLQLLYSGAKCWLSFMVLMFHCKGRRWVWFFRGFWGLPWSIKWRRALFTTAYQNLVHLQTVSLLIQLSSVTTNHEKGLRGWVQFQMNVIGVTDFWFETFVWRFEDVSKWLEIPILHGTDLCSESVNDLKLQQYILHVNEKMSESDLLSCIVL
jgi:hypothetical protein